MTYAKLVRKTTQEATSFQELRNFLTNFIPTGLLQNVLHWHIVDTQSFPLEIPSYPKLWNGAYSRPERYTFADAIEIVRQVGLFSVFCFTNLHMYLLYVSDVFVPNSSYAKRRGINVLAELDVPGHAESWYEF